MITADKARAMANAAINDRLKEAYAAIEDACDSGYFNCTVGFTLSLEQMSELRENGFVVTVHKSRSDISWPRKA